MNGKTIAMGLAMALGGWAMARSGDSPGDDDAEVTVTAADDSAARSQRTQDKAEASTRIASATRGVLGSRHDFSRVTGRAGDACGACHVPHVQAVKPEKSDDDSFALAFYRVGGQREVLSPGRVAPGPTSLMCLSCHNGIAAPSTVGSSHVLLSAHREGFQIGEFSTRDHPIGVEYPSRKEGYKNRAVVLGMGKISMPDNRVECVSCHDPHNAAGEEKMLVMSNRRSALCLSCHEK